MNSRITRWTIRLLVARRHTLDLSPAYQRGPAWSVAQKSLFIDSLFRGLEIPLIFVAGRSSNPLSRRDVIDGQQRLRAIFDFVDGPIVRVPGDAVGRIDRRGIRFAELTDAERERFFSRRLPICSLDGIKPRQKRLQFERLQLGQHLKPVELRNAMASPVPVQIRNIAETHPFFDCAGIPEGRYKREDYLTHVLALAYFASAEGWRDIKAPALRQFIQSHRRGIPIERLTETEEILTLMEGVARLEKGVFKNKWSFVDTFSFIRVNRSLVERLNTKKFAKRLNQIEILRKRYYRDTETLLEEHAPVRYARELYAYVMAYKTGGAVRTNIETRQQYMRKII